MKKAILAALQLPILLFGILQRISFGSKRGRQDKLERDHEEERLDRLRNPRDYGPGKEE